MQRSVPRSPVSEMPEYARKVMLADTRKVAFYCMCEMVGCEALPSQIDRLRARAIELFEPKDYDAAQRAASAFMIDLKLEMPV